MAIPTAGDPVLNEVVRRLVEAYRPAYIYLFGSAARGDAGPDSDYDIMVVVPDEAPREMQECDLAYRTLRGLGIAKDILVWTRSEFEKRLHLKASLPSAILQEGKVLHAEFDASAWDRQFEADVKAGKFDSLAEQALDDHAAGRSREL